MSSRNKRIKLSDGTQGGLYQTEKAKIACRSYSDPSGFEVRFVDDCIGEGVFTTREFKKGDFLLEYKGDLIRNYKHALKLEREYGEAGLGSFIFFFKYKEQTMCIDATNDIFRQGRMINDAVKGSSNNNSDMKIIPIDGVPHLCCFATRNIKAKEELRYDYGVPNLPWRKDARISRNQNCSDEPETQRDKTFAKAHVATKTEMSESVPSTSSSNVEDQTRPACTGTKQEEYEHIMTMESPGLSEIDDHIATKTEMSESVPSTSSSNVEDQTRPACTGTKQEEYEHIMTMESPGLSEIDDSDKDCDYVPSEDISCNSEDSEPVPLVPNIHIFQKKSPKKKQIVHPSSIESSLLGVAQFQQPPPQSNQSNDAELQQIKVSQTNNSDYRHYDKRFYCMYCEKPQSKLPKHLITQHKDEPDVMDYIDECDKKSKMKLYEKIKNIGNHLHNVQVLKSGKGELSVAYRQRGDQAIKAEEYGPCPACYAYYPRRVLWRHKKKCSFSSQLPMGTRLATSSQTLLPTPVQSSKRLTDILASLRQDDISRIVKSDPTIIAFGEKLCTKKGHTTSHYDYIRQKMRELARMLQIMRTRDSNSSKSFEQFMFPGSFQFIVSCCKEATGFDEMNHTYSIPSYALKLGGSFKKCLEILCSKGMETQNRDLQSRTEDLIKLFNFNWTDDISSNALRTLKEAKRNSNKSLLPLAEDVKKMTQHLKREAEVCSKQLQAKADEISTRRAWTRLSEICLSQTILFNRRRTGEVSKMEIEDYVKKSIANADGEFDTCLSNTEKSLCKQFYRTEINAKSGIAGLLFPRQVNENLDLLLRTRDIIRNSTNIYLFPTATTKSHIRGHDCLRKYAKESRAVHPERLRGTKLRKQIATMTQLFNLSENELDILANFLGHDIRVHREFYRLPQETLQVAKVSKLLLLMEKGQIKQTSINSLDDIEIDVDGDAIEDSDTDDDDDDDSGSSEDDDAPDRSIQEVPAPGPSKQRDQPTFDRLPTNGAKRKHVEPSKQKQKRMWNAEERAAVHRHLEKFILLGRLPGKNDIVKCLQAEPDLRDRNWSNVKDFCRNSIETRKRQRKY